MPDTSAATVILDAAPHAFFEPMQLDIMRPGNIIADQLTSDGRYVVVADHNVKHRLWLCDDCVSTPIAFVIPVDQGFAVRMAATRSFERYLRGRSNGDLPTELCPTAFQRRRLALLLHLIDADQAQSTRREIAFTLVYPRLEPLGGAAWKGSSERRQTQRLIDEAVRMMCGGYRALLQG